MLRWEDERYVRFYTRNTPQWRSMTWKARGLFGLILREVDRAGILDLGNLGPKGVAVAVAGAWDEVSAPLDELLENGCCIIVGTKLLIPNFLAAQEANQTDRARKRKSRELARTAIHTGIVTKRDLQSHGVTFSHKNGQNVTRGHTRSHAVTRGHSVPGLADPCLADPCLAGPLTTLSSSVPEPDRLGSYDDTRSNGSNQAVEGLVAQNNGIGRVELATTPDGAVMRIFEVYRSFHPRARLDAKRAGLIGRAIAISSESDCEAAVRGNHVDPHCCGLNDRGQQYHDLSLILRDGDHITRYGEIWERHLSGAKPGPVLSEIQMRNAAVFARAADRHSGEGGGD